MIKTTPMMEQYKAIKINYQDCLLFYRMGDFYEMFGEDAVVGSKALEITLTARGKDENGKIPMCGVPYHAVEAYIAKAIEQGFKVAICEQVEDPKTAKGVVKREVIRVITPGTVVDSILLKEDAANYLAAVFPCGQGFGLAYSDISTGDFFVSQVTGQSALAKLSDELSRIDPKECIVTQKLYDEDFYKFHLWNRSAPVAITPLADELFVRKNAEALLLTQFKLASLNSIGLENMAGGMLAAASLLYFVQMTQKRELSYINKLQVYSIDNYVLMDSNTRRNLELTSSLRTGRKRGSLYNICDRTETALGSRMLREWLEKPLLSSAEVNLRLDGIEDMLKNNDLHQRLINALKNIYDLERLIGRVVYGNATPRDLLALKNSIANLPEVQTVLAGFGSSITKQVFDQFDDLRDIFQIIDQAIREDTPISLKDGKVIKDGYNQDIDELRKISEKGIEFLLQLEADEKEKTGIKSLKIRFNKVFGYYIEVTNNNLDLVPETYIRKQTLVNCERFITEELKIWESKILGASERLISIETELFNQLRDDISAHTQRIQLVAKCIALVDCLSGLATVAKENGFVKPVVDDSDILEIIDGRHPMVEESIGRENYVANSTYMDNENNQFALITGPNMAGKSTYMRQVALCVIMARVGSYIPAKQGRIGYIDRIFTRVGASDDLAAGQSTFMVEMCETSNIIRNATNKSLIILDEIGRGTSTYDGLSIAWAVSEYILQPALGAKTLFATHYHELIQLADTYPAVQNYSIAVKENNGSIIFLRQIVAGGTDKSYGIHVAKLAGLPDSIIIRANQILAGLTTGQHTPKLEIDSWEHDVANNIEEAANPILSEIVHLDLTNLRPVEALLYLEKWQNSLNDK